ncbi:hypothetical protein DFH08DRAFT_724538, partial [Mycena albidolilacea]
QKAYTTTFGAHTPYLFLRTSSIIPLLTAHIFCNIMDFPQLQSEMCRFPAQNLGELPVAFRSLYVFGLGVYLCFLVLYHRTRSRLN